MKKKASEKSKAQLEAEHRILVATVQGESDPRQISGFFFREAKHILWETAVKADPERQLPSAWPRNWYVEADFECRKCRKEFTWNTTGQRLWFEVYKLSTDAVPLFCLPCRRAARRLSNLRKEYDAKIASARKTKTKEEKQRIIEILNELLEAHRDLPAAMQETKTCFERQLARLLHPPPGEE
jgi:hypothetical protein